MRVRFRVKVGKRDPNTDFTDNKYIGVPSDGSWSGYLKFKGKKVNWTDEFESQVLRWRSDREIFTEQIPLIPKELMWAPLKWRWKWMKKGSN